MKTLADLCESVCMTPTACRARLRKYWPPTKGVKRVYKWDEGSFRRIEAKFRDHTFWYVWTYIGNHSESPRPIHAANAEHAAKLVYSEVWPAPRFQEAARVFIFATKPAHVYEGPYPFMTLEDIRAIFVRELGTTLFAQDDEGLQNAYRAELARQKRNDEFTTLEAVVVALCHGPSAFRLANM